ncbi:MAG: hypothetical protein ACI8RZ_000202 [Myxococcota bacterium]|jgi:hypothetical protein
MRLGRMVRFSGLQLHLNVGRILIEDLYDGDLEAWRARGAKEASIRKLAKLTRINGVAISRSVLHRSMQIYALLQRIGEDWSNLGVSHFRAVLSISDDDQLRLLKRAENGCWTVRQLEAEVRALRPSPPQPPAFVTEINRLEQAVTREGLLFGDLDRLSFLSAAQLQTLSDKLRQIRQAFDGLENQINSALGLL